MSFPFDDNRYVATIISHHDADTSRVLVALGMDVSVKLTVRWRGINAPELSTPEGHAALDLLNVWMPKGHRCILETRRDAKEKYGRYLGTFYAIDAPDGTSYNRQLIDAGHAVPYDGGPR